jgi:uncharacterized protein YndB with AHSA1/START domain
MVRVEVEWVETHRYRATFELREAVPPHLAEWGFPIEQEVYAKIAELADAELTPDPHSSTTLLVNGRVVTDA